MTVPTFEERLSAEFPAAEVRHFEGRGGKSLSYIEDEAVMDRLDAVVGVGSWQIHVESVPVYEGVVKVRLGVRIAHDEWQWFEDFGYPNNGTAGEALKEAVSDGIRRCGRYLGIGRYLYRKEQPTTQGSQPTSTARQPQAAPSVVPPAAGGEPAWPDDATIAAVDGGQCSVHHKAWRINSRGYYCSSKVADGWCREQPPKAWIARQEVA